jgi:flavin-binding protein dodecin
MAGRKLSEMVRDRFTLITDLDSKVMLLGTSRADPSTFFNTRRSQAMAIVKVVELVGTSKKSWEDAVHQVAKEASGSLRHITGVDVVHQTAHVEDGKISEYRATVHVAFAVEHHSHILGAGVRPGMVGADATP